MNLLRRLILPDMMERLFDIAHGQAIVIEEQRAVIESLYRDIEQTNLGNARWGSAMIARFLDILDGTEDPDDAQRVLRQALKDMREEVSRLEEHVL